MVKIKKLMNDIDELIERLMREGNAKSSGVPTVDLEALVEQRAQDRMVCEKAGVDFNALVALVRGRVEAANPGEATMKQEILQRWHGKGEGSFFHQHFGKSPAVQAIERVCGSGWNGEDPVTIVTEAMPPEIQAENLRKGWIEER